MAYKSFTLGEDLKVTIYKRRNARSLRLALTPAGQVKVSIPSWAPYRAGLEFVKSKADWIKANQPPINLIKPGQAIGKAHHIDFVPSASQLAPTSRISQSRIVITHSDQDHPGLARVQRSAQAAAVRALRSQASALLPQRLEVLAKQHGLGYTSVKIKLMKSRWGSCDQHQNIVLNLYLIQLSWKLIDYVLVHELTHTQVLKHGPEFWQAMERLLPNVKDLKRELRQHQPVLDGWGAEAVT